ncbi:MAG: hypothetical protein BWY06_03201 [Candidatus Latescibacteria bacterium ADurb.Bin168]|nr:MAG: hypothetical protein BWY06_03201 [Candidatus Latescibacteria bacterium ADurb.Bin168]
MAGKSVQMYVQAALKTKLTSAVTVSNVAVPVVDNPYDGQAAPYIVCNQIVERQADTFSTTERWFDVTVDSYTTDYRTQGTVTNKDIRRQIINTLAGTTLSVTGATFRACIFTENGPDFIEGDGDTVHGQCRFRIHVDTLT